MPTAIGSAYVELVVADDAGEHEADRHVQHRADHERPEDADRHVAFRVLGLLRGGRDCIKADIGKEDNGCAAHDAAETELAGTGTGRNELSAGIAGCHPMRGADKGRRRDDEQHDDDKFDGDDRGVDVRGLADASRQERGHDGDDDHRRRVDHGAGRVPGVLRGVVIEGRTSESGRNGDAEVRKEADHVTGPADRNRCGAQRIFQQQIPTDDPGHDLAHRRIGISISAAGDRYGRGQLGVTQPGEAADDRAQHER